MTDDDRAPEGIDTAAPVVSRGEITVDAPLAAVWTLQTDVEAWPVWQSAVSESRRLDPGPLRPGSRFRWTTEGLAVTSTVHVVEEHRRLLWGGPAHGIEGLHLWTFAEVEGGVVVRTEESWSGAPVEADVVRAQSLLDASLAQWLSALAAAAEHAAGR